MITKIRMCSEFPVYFTVFDLGEISVDAQMVMTPLYGQAMLGPVERRTQYDAQSIHGNCLA